MNTDMNNLDTAKLATFLEAQLVGFKGPISIKKFAGGQSNPTFLISADSGEYVLRCQPPGKLLKGAHAVDREYRALTALEKTAVPVAKPYLLCEDPEVIGSMFYVMSFEKGQIFWDPALPDVLLQQRSPLYSELIRVMAALHDVDIHKVGLSDYGRTGNYFERQINVWTKQYRAAETETIDAMEMLTQWLPANVPADDGQLSIVHGDFRIDNLIFDTAEPHVLAVLDWELSTLGHPLADLAYFCMCLRLPSTWPVAGLGDKDRVQWGIPTEAELIAQYCTLRGIDGIKNWSFYLAFSFFRLAAIVQGVLKRALDGNASSDHALQVGKMAGPLAAMAVKVLENESDSTGINVN